MPVDADKEGRLADRDDAEKEMADRDDPGQDDDRPTAGEIATDPLLELDRYRGGFQRGEPAARLRRVRFGSVDQ
ncbi:MAG TPA: hypothetical protein VFY18_14880 [Candidatus Limnocylindrales bacterium]|nr:hypothetical protein [Candidatus Limnocylindrales bacterium]